jgi:hypothetical protein
VVDVLMLESLGSADPFRLLDVSREYGRMQDSGLEQAFFSRRTIYEASAYTQRDADGNETGFLGHVIVQSDGDLGFDPSVVFQGEVRGESVHDVIAAGIASEHSGSRIWSDLLAGDDVIWGNGYITRISGYKGDDVLLNTSPIPPGGNYAYLKGNGGDDLLFSGGASGMSGGGGADRFVIDALQQWSVADFAHGTDKVLFDEATFPELAGGVTEANFHVGKAAGDEDDRLIVNATKNAFHVYVDPDGSGPQAQTQVGYIRTRDQLTFDDFGVVDAGTLIPDIFGDAARPGVVPLAQADLHAPYGQGDLLPMHHGITQLA